MYKVSIKVIIWEKIKQTIYFDPSFLTSEYRVDRIRTRSNLFISRHDRTYPM